MAQDRCYSVVAATQVRHGAVARIVRELVFRRATLLITGLLFKNVFSINTNTSCMSAMVVGSGSAVGVLRELFFVLRILYLSIYAFNWCVGNKNNSCAWAVFRNLSAPLCTITFCEFA